MGNGLLYQDEEELSVISGGLVCYTRMNGLLYKDELSVTLWEMVCIPGGMVCYARMNGLLYQGNGLLYQEEWSVMPG